jgi:hypothetical protein
MKVNYNPFNKSYQFICLQNQIAHYRNKHSVKARGNSNISLSKSIHSFSDRKKNNQNYHIQYLDRPTRIRKN